MKLHELFEAQQWMKKDLVGYTYDNHDKVFRCCSLGLTSLKGAPSHVESFACDRNDLKSLKYAPTVTKYFNCDRNKLTSLEGAPETVGEGGFGCSHNLLTSLEHAPKSTQAIFWCENNLLTSLHNVHKQIESINGEFVLTSCPIKECVLGLLKIKKLKNVDLDNKEVMKIINKYLPEGDIIECQSELIEAGYEEFAKL
jgi:hypothetical protein